MVPVLHPDLFIPPASGKSREIPSLATMLHGEALPVPKSLLGISEGEVKQKGGRHPWQKKPIPEKHVSDLSF